MIIIMLLLASFLHQYLLVIFHWCLNDYKFHQVSRTLLSILVDLDNDVVWIVTIRPPISNSSSSLSKLFATVPKAPFPFGIIITIIFHSFPSSLSRSRSRSIAHTHTHTHTHIYIYIYIYISTDIRTYMCMSARTCVCLIHLSCMQIKGNKIKITSCSRSLHMVYISAADLLGGMFY